MRNLSTASREQPCSLQLEKKPCSKEDPKDPKINKNNEKRILSSLSDKTVSHPLNFLNIIAKDAGIVGMVYVWQ